MALARLEAKALGYLERFDSSAANLRAVLGRYAVRTAGCVDGRLPVDCARVIDELVSRYVASGLVSDARIAVDSEGIYAAFAGENEDAPVELAEVPPGGGERSLVHKLEVAHTVEAVALDDDCVYWADRESGSGKLKFFAKAR